ncbi:MAG: MarR family transcriptional regulator, partial [Fimbriimonadaceae bacterium]|nr:MarR family transcriptional regulator [Alphaproteobacteria bacterium]
MDIETPENGSENDGENTSQNGPQNAQGYSADRAGKSIAAGELANRLFFRLYQCANQLHKTGTKALEAHGITTQQWAVLGALSRPTAAKGITVGALAKYLMVSRQNITGVLARLEKRGYLERLNDANDGRARLIRLTPGGRALWDQQITPLIFDFYENALDKISTDDQVTILHYLNRLIENFRNIDE